MPGVIGTVTGPVAVGALVDSISYDAAFWLAAAVLGGAAVLGAFAPETRRAGQEPRVIASAPDGSPQADPVR